MTNNEKVLDILSVARGPSEVWIVADALRRLVGPELGSVVMAVAGIWENRVTDDEMSTEEIAEAYWSASERLAGLADDVLWEYRFDAMPHIERPHGEWAPKPPMFSSVRGVAMQEAAE